MSDSPVHEDFSGPYLSRRLHWQSEPAYWRLDREASRLVIEPDAGSDFWQRTHYGFEADNGHFLFLEAPGDFVLTTEVTWHAVNQYDQAGLMVRMSKACWLKTSVEYEPEGPSRLGAVVTNMQFSDWSTQALTRGVTTAWFRISANAGDFAVHWSLDGRGWEMLRLCHLQEHADIAPIRCGLYACSPKGTGFRAAFSFLDLSPASLMKAAL
jgi:hypothetical protein